MWVPPEQRDPTVLHHPTRKSVGYFGAVRLRDGQLAFQRELERFNAQPFFAFLKRLSARTGRRVIVITDNARYHHAKLHRPWRDQHSEHFALDFLPPYSPKLNPIERVWKLVRRLRLHNRYFPTLEAIVSVVEGLFSDWGTSNETLRRLCAMT
jgi:transposase